MHAVKLLVFLLAVCVIPGESTVLYVQAGADASLACDVPENSDMEWRFNNVLVFKVNGKTGTKIKGTSRLSNIEKSKIAGITLKIFKVNKDDSGEYSCRRTGEKMILHVVSVFVKPHNPVLKSSDAELHCEISADPEAKVEWLKPPNGIKQPTTNQVLHLKSVRAEDQGLWSCKVNDLTMTIQLTLIDLATKNATVPLGGDIQLPCSLTGSSHRVIGGKWSAHHNSAIAFPTLDDTGGLRWKGQSSSKVAFSSEQLNTDFSITLKNVQKQDEGIYVCSVEFDTVVLKAEMNLKVLRSSSSDYNEQTIAGTAKTPVVWSNFFEDLSRTTLGLPLWAWVALGVGSVVLMVLTVLILVILRRNRRVKVRGRRTMRKPLTDQDYCQCHKSDSEVRVSLHPVTKNQRYSRIPH